jgi:hypothetical protein
MIIVDLKIWEATAIDYLSCLISRSWRFLVDSTKEKGLGLAFHDISRLEELLACMSACVLAKTIPLGVLGVYD